MCGFLWSWFAYLAGPDRLYRRARAASLRGDFSRALAWLDLAIRRRPDFAEAYLQRGIAYAALGLPERAVADFTRVVGGFSVELSLAYVNRAAAHEQMGALEQALADSETAARIAPDRLLPYYNRCRVLARLGERVRALEDYRRCQQLGLLPQAAEQLRQ